MKGTRVLIVDDSLTMRHVLRAALENEPDIEVVGAASDPYEAREMIKALSPDVLTLDVQMPRMNGIDFLENLMRLRPMPVVMVSNHTGKGAALAVRALSLGAVECVGKPTIGTAESAFADLPAILRAAARSTPRSPQARSAPLAAGAAVRKGSLILIGASTGGVEAITEVLSGFPPDCPATLVVQHMPAHFTESFTQHLDRISAAEVRVARDGDPVAPGVVLVAPGAAAHLTLANEKRLVCRLRTGDKINGHRPSVDALFHSAIPFAARTTAAILTGLGADGAAGIAALRREGARTVGQSEASCVVFGMPRAAGELGGVERYLPIERIGRELISLSAKREPTSSSIPAAGG